ncbi:MAG: dipeptide ABC transporter ATP-binding protein [Elusimicrobia bacterium]|nr:dipeptide ABC transporter ATP-binding protein [Elusimicrobiota bacterium]
MQPLVEVKNLKKHFPIYSGFFSKETEKVHAVDGVNFRIHPQESFALVGESGCGKTTLGRMILGLESPTTGEVFFENKDIFKLPKKELRQLRRQMQVIFQDPFSSLNPRMTVEQILAEPLTIHQIYADPGERRKRVAALVEVVGLSQKHLNRYPHEFSGGQRQRIGIARALALNPKLVVADEPVSALDVSIQAQILNLLKDLQKEFHLTYLFISHDFSVVKHLCDRVAVMYLGKVVELGLTDEIFSNPQHPYTEALLSAIPIPDPGVERMRKRILLTGDVPSPIHPPSGCRFHPRCQYAQPNCQTQEPPTEEIFPERWLACPVAPFKNKPSETALVEIQ